MLGTKKSYPKVFLSMGFPFSIGRICSYVPPGGCCWRIRKLVGGGLGLEIFERVEDPKTKYCCVFLQLRTRHSPVVVQWGAGWSEGPDPKFSMWPDPNDSQPAANFPRWQPRPSLEIFEARPLCRRGASGVITFRVSSRWFWPAAEGVLPLMGIGPHGVTNPVIMLFTECHGLLLFPLFSIDIVDTAKTPYPNCSNNAPHPHHTSSLGCTT